MKNFSSEFKKIQIVNPLDLLTYSGIKQVPLIMQSEVAECGLASLAMISSYYGYKTNISQLRQYAALDSQGISLKRLMDVASDLNLATRAVKCEIEDINQLKLPCVIHWNLDHFVVLTRVTKTGVYINDPAVGKRKMTYRQFSDSYTGIALELNPTSDFKKKDVREKMKITQLWDKITGLKRILATLLFLSILLQFVALLSPYYMQMVIDNVLLSNDKALLSVLAFGYIILTLVLVFASFLRSWFVIRFSSNMNIQMGANLFHHLMRLSMDFFEKRHIGDVVSRFGSLNTVRNLLATGIIETIIDGLVAVVVLMMMYLYSPDLTKLVLIVVLLSFAIQLAFYYPNRRITEESIVATAKEDSNFLESIRAIQTIKLFGHETARQNIWLNRYAEVINADIRLGKLNIIESALNGLLWGGETSFVVYFGALAVIDGSLTVGMLLAFIAYKGQFTSSITGFIDRLISFKLLNLHLERLSDITLQEKENHKSKTSPSRHINGNLKIENLSFRYSEKSEWVFRNLSFQIYAGESVAIVGTSGCGKTTLIKILLGLLKPTSGKIYIDGMDANELSLGEYRRQFGAVMQNDTLLSGTLYENLTMFDSSYDEKKLIECCQVACIWDFIQSLPMGLYSLVGDMGSCFSGGQLQRIYLARALYREPKILCLDESTSHLDQENELAINKNINKLTMTRIIIAHRKETIETAERVIQLDASV